ncbi:hypothetical protein VT99_12051 [Candidatus Electrothrix marina]|uniref:Porin n=1 Tax=Candidatus Electrothrix marina TaxID=1859130 RepID=A0A3S3R8F2_9BACT|nr:hypothetical protein VT99_12051 [Candidatus Electrothrix marina]
MKKVLVAGAALMLAGSMVSAASAGNPEEAPEETTGVSISGDARVTYVGGVDYYRVKTDLSADGYGDYFDSRVGVNVDAVAKGGASVHARMYFDDQGWNDDVVWNTGVTGDAQLGVSTDYAYIKVPLSDTLTVKAGRLPLNFSPFYAGEIRPTRVQVIYESGNLKLVPWIGVVTEEGSDLDDLNDSDFMQYGIIPVLKLNDAWTLKGYFRYNDDAREWANDPSVETVGGVEVAVPATAHRDSSGFDGSVNLSGTAGNVGLTAEVSYKAADVQGTEDDGTGGYIQAAFSMPGITPIVLAGMTQDGFMAFRDFGFVMVGGNESTTVVNVGNSKGDLMFGALVLLHDISDRFSVQGNLLYASYDYENDSVAASQLDSAIEISGVMNYAVSESTSFEYKLGYLAPTYNDGAADIYEDAYIGQVLRMNVAF